MPHLAAFGLPWLAPIFLIFVDSVHADASPVQVEKSKLQVGAGELSGSSKRTGNLRRADFLISGVSCAACLIRLERKLGQAPGVLKVSVSIYRPYAAVVIYDSKKTSTQEVNKILSAEHAKATSLSDAEIAQAPLVLVPKSLPEGTEDRK